MICKPFRDPTKSVYTLHSRIYFSLKGALNELATFYVRTPEPGNGKILELITKQRWFRKWTFETPVMLSLPFCIQHLKLQTLRPWRCSPTLQQLPLRIN